MTLRFRGEIGGLAMRPEMNSSVQDASDGGRPYADTYGRPAGAGTPGEPPAPAGSDPARGARHAGNEPLLRVLSQQRGPDAVMLGTLGVALFCGLIGFAVHFLWVIAVLVMALGLGFVIADARRNRIDLVRQQDEAGSARERDRSGTAPSRF